MAVDIQQFYAGLPVTGVVLKDQWPKFRDNFNTLQSIVRATYADISSDPGENDVSGFAVGELNQRYRYRIFYDKSNDRFSIQYNTGTEASPTWVDALQIRDSDRRVTISSGGGLSSSGGFYDLGLISVEAHGVSGGAAFENVGTLLFNYLSGFYVTPDSAGRPVVSLNVEAAAGVVQDGSNLGSGREVFASKSGTTLQFRTLTEGSNVTLTQSANSISVAASGEANTASNLGSGTGVFSDKSGVDLRFKSLTGGENIAISSSSTEVSIASTSGPGFYGVVFKESESGGRVERDDTLVVDSSSGFYLGQNGDDGKPLLSLHDHVTSVSSSSTGDETVISSDTASGAGHAIVTKRLTAGSNITLSSDSNQITIASTASGGGGGFYGVVFKESESGGRVERDDTLVFNSSSGFYLEQAGDDGKPLLSFHDHVTSVAASGTGDESLISSDTASGAGHSIVLKNLTAGLNITLTPDGNQITIASSALDGGFYGVLFKETESGGYSERDDEVNFDSNFFYVTSNNRGKPLVSLLVAGSSQNVVTDSSGKLTTLGGTREILTANRTYYVRTDGSDSNNGFSNTSGSAFATIQKAVDIVAGLDLSIYDVTIQLGNTGSYAGANVTAPFVGGPGSSVTLVGSTSDPGSYVLTSKILVQNYAVFAVQGVDFTPSSGHCLEADLGGVVNVTGTVIFGAASGNYHLFSHRGAIMLVTANYTIDGAATNHVNIEDGGYLDTNSLTVTLTGTPAFTTYCSCAALGNYLCNGMTFSGSATGARYGVSTNSVVRTGGGGANYFPGDAAGSTSTGGQYT